MCYPGGKVINPHIHPPVARSLQDTQEVLIIKRGKVRVDIYDDGQNYLESHLLEAGDVILLVSGGHGFEILEEADLIEVKQGPYLGEGEKVRFQGITADQIKWRE
jgi:mannose-6-phosphate isomerase-like protein (cupin superfamily)